jgi:hypothetical protein
VRERVSVDVSAPAARTSVQPLSADAYDGPLPDPNLTPRQRAEMMLETARTSDTLPADDDALGRTLTESFDGTNTSEMTPAQKWRAIYHSHGPAEAKRFAFGVLNQLRQRHTPNDQIARIFDVTVRTIRNWTKELREKTADDVARLDLNGVIGDSMLLYSEVIRMALSECSTRGLTPSQKANFMRMAVYAQGRKDALLLGYGVVQQKPYRPDEDDKPKQDMNDIFQAVKNSINGVFEIADTVDEDHSNSFNILY